MYTYLIIGVNTSHKTSLIVKIQNVFNHEEDSDKKTPINSLQNVAPVHSKDADYQTKLPSIAKFRDLMN